MSVKDRIVPFLAADWPDVDKTAQQLAPAGGIIIVSYCRLTDEYYYLYDCFSKNCDFHKFDNDTEKEDPYVFYRLSAALTKLEVARAEEYRQKNFDHFLALWVHPDVGVILDKYKKMSGFRFPGCPTQ